MYSDGKSREQIWKSAYKLIPSNQEMQSNKLSRTTVNLSTQQNSRADLTPLSRLNSEIMTTT